MFNKKALLAAVLLLGTAGGLVACGQETGNEYYVHVDFGGADVIAKFPATRIISIHDQVRIGFKTEKVHFFDPETEEAL